MALGKLRRFLLVSFARGKVRRKLERREGSCARCGTCCKLLLRCPALVESNGIYKCLIYDDRPGVCGLFPLDEKDIEERNIIRSDIPCGYSFFSDPKSNGRMCGLSSNGGSDFKPCADDAANDVSPKPRVFRSARAFMKLRLRQWKAARNNGRNGNGSKQHGD